MTASAAQVNPYVRALLHGGWAAIAAAALLGMIGLQEASRLGMEGGAVQLAISGWLLNIGVAALLLWLLAAAVVWQPRAPRLPGPTARSAKSHWD